MLDYPVYLVHLITAHPFLAPLVCVIIYIVLRQFKIGPKTGKWVIPVGLLLFINFFTGSYVNAVLLHRVGEIGEAKVTGIHATGTRYNDQRVTRHDVLLRTRDGKVVETSFRDDDFNIYPSHNRVTYPQAGDEFHVSYLRHFPGAFVIITNDDSPWAGHLNCANLQKQLLEARRKYEFDRNNADYRKTYIAAIQQYINNHCYSDSTDLEKYDGDINYIRQGKSLSDY
jgi:hypothetical protein